MGWDLLQYLLKFNKKKICLINSGKLLNNWKLLGGEKNSNLRHVCYFSGLEATTVCEFVFFLKEGRHSTLLI